MFKQHFIQKSILKEIGKQAQLSLALFLLQVNWYEWKIQKSAGKLYPTLAFILSEKNISTVNGFSYTSLSLFPCCFVRDKNTENIANEIIQ